MGGIAALAGPYLAEAGFSGAWWQQHWHSAYAAPLLTPPTIRAGKRLCVQADRLKRITLSSDLAYNSRVLIAESPKLLDARLGLLGRDAGQESAGGLRVEQQSVVRMLGRPVYLANSPSQPNILRLQGRKNALLNDLQSTGQDRQPFHIEGNVNS